MGVYYNEKKQTFIESDLPINILEEKGYSEIWLVEYNIGEEKEKKFWTLMCHRSSYGYEYCVRDEKVLREFISGLQINEGKYCEKVSEIKIESLNTIKAYLEYLKVFIKKSLPDRWSYGWQTPILKVENMSIDKVPFYLVSDLAFSYLIPNINFDNYLDKITENNNSIEIIIPQYKCKSFSDCRKRDPFWEARTGDYQEEFDWLYYPFISLIVSLEISEKYYEIESDPYRGVEGRKEEYEWRIDKYPSNFNYEFKVYDITGLSVDDVDFDNIYTSVIFLQILKKEFDRMLGKNTKAISELKNRVVKDVRVVFEDELKVNEGIRRKYITDAEKIRQQYIQVMEATRLKYVGEIESLQLKMDTLSGDSRFNGLKENFLKDISTIIQKSYLEFEVALESILSDIDTKKQELVTFSNKLNYEIDKIMGQAQVKIKEIIEKEKLNIEKLNKELNDIEQRRDKLVSSIIEEVVREVIKRNPVQEININLSDDSIKRKIRGIYHQSFKEVLQLVYLKTPVFLVGPAGCGKNVMLKQVAKVLDLDFYYINDAREKYDLLGFVDANGKYQETQFYKAFTKGGLLMIDELDSADPSVLLLLNSALGTGDDFYMTFPDGNQYQAHPNFHLVAAANTFGTGANPTYNGRNQLDGASLNRFLPVPVDYDTNIEKSLTNNQAILPLYWEVRRVVRENEINYVVSTRNILNADKYLSAKVFSLDKIFTWTLVGSLQDFDLATIISNIKTNDSYSQAFIDFVKRTYNIKEATNKNNNGYGNNNSSSYDTGYDDNDNDYYDKYGNGNFGRSKGRRYY